MVQNQYNSKMTFEERPWGNYTVIHADDKCQVKKLVVHPGKRLSLQSHKFRAEHWFVVSGQGTAHLDGKEIEVGPGNSVDVPIGSKHRITCTDSNPLVFIEVQTGSSFAEEDIVRFEDDFNRS
jgi:mannose-6-phosphate isomerase-like protein (cupin superfamily)